MLECGLWRGAVVRGAGASLTTAGTDAGPFIAMLVAVVVTRALPIKVNCCAEPLSVSADPSPDDEIDLVASSRFLGEVPGVGVRDRGPAGLTWPLPPAWAREGGDAEAFPPTFLGEHGSGRDRVRGGDHLESPSLGGRGFCGGHRRGEVLLAPACW